MWVTKVSINGENAHLGSKTLKHKINLIGFPISWIYQKKWIIVNIAGNLQGTEQDKKQFIQELKQSKRTVNLEINGNFFIGTIKEPLIAKTIYNPDLFYLSPAIIDEKGIETITIGSFDKKKIEKFLTTLEKLYESQIHFIQQKKITNISINKLNPELTKKQKQAMEIAIKNKYYDSPRGTSVKKLAKELSLSFSTFQVHLRKAEKKLIPYFFQ